MLDERSFVLGLIASSGKFGFVESKDKIYPKFYLQTMIKNADMIFRIKKYFGLGNISINKNNTVYFQIRSQEECMELIKIIGNDLSTPNYLAWKSAIYFKNSGKTDEVKMLIQSLKDVNKASDEDVMKIKNKIKRLDEDTPKSSLLNDII